MLGEVLSLNHLSALIGALDVFKLAVARKVGGNFAHLVLPSTAFAFVSAEHFKIFNIAVHLFISECCKSTGIGALGIWTSLRVRGFATSLKARLQTGTAENIAAAVAQIRISAG